MVNFDRLGARAGEKGYSTITESWDNLAPKQRKIIKTLIQHPEKSQKEIAEYIGDVDPAHVHNVVYSLPPEQYTKYRAEFIHREFGLQADTADMPTDEEGRVMVNATFPMEVDIKLPRRDLENATTAALSLSSLGRDGATTTE